MGALLDTVQHAISRDDPQEARRICVAWLAEDGGDASAHRYLGLVEAMLGNRGAAEQSAQRACELSARDPRSWSDLGRVQVLFGDMRRAAESFAASVRIDPNFADGWHNLGATLRKLGQLEGAFIALKKALLIDPARAAAFLELGNLLIETNQFDDALECFERAARHEPGMARARSRLGEQMSRRRKVRRAERMFRLSVTLDPGHIEGWLGLGRILEDTGDIEGARDAYLNVLRRRPQHGAALGFYLSIATGDAEECADQARDLLAAGALPDSAQALIGYGLAKYRDRRGDIAQAAQAALRGNAARRRTTGPLDRAALTARIDGLIATYPEAFFAERRGFGAGTDQPVFIVGLPRSGTTLTEQIIAAHPDMHGAGELPDLSRLAAGLAGMDEAWKAAGLLDEGRSRLTAAAYLRVLRDGAPRGRRRISDKAPLNFFQLAFAALLFPGARVVHCRRAAEDNALSIWLENFNPEQRYATDFADIAFFRSEYERLMAHWRAVLPLRILELQYEETVADPEAQARRLLDFLGVTWDPRCLDFHTAGRAVQTPSRWQVRQPIYSRSVGRWRAYAEHLPELAAALRQPGSALPPSSSFKPARGSGSEEQTSLNLGSGAPSLLDAPAG